VIDPYYDDGRAALYQGDALALLAQLPAGGVDAVMADPPYSSGGAFRGDRANADLGAKYNGTAGALWRSLDHFSGDNRDQRAYAYWSALWLSEALRITAPGGVCMVWTDWRQLPTTTDALQAGGWVWRGIVPWHKPMGSSRPQMGRFGAACEYVVWGSAGPMGAGLDVGCLPGFYQAAPPRVREHITQKPLDVMRSLVRICPAGGVVLDPFMGSGTTGVAALNEGRRFIGFELSEHYAAVARERVSTAAMAPKPDQLDLLEMA
jgi:site-specific DNA-methyltransferase (adenine-specific)